MSSNEYNRNQNTRFRSTTDCFYCIVVEETKIFFNLSVNFFMYIYLDLACTITVLASVTSLQLALETRNPFTVGTFIFFF